MAGDALAYGVSAVLLHWMPNGEEQPIAFTSHTLSAAKRNCSQVEKEALACIFAVKQSHSYIYGHQFSLQKDRKLLLTLLGEAKAVPLKPL